MDKQRRWRAVDLLSCLTLAMIAHSIYQSQAGGHKANAQKGKKEGVLEEKSGKQI